MLRGSSMSACCGCCASSLFTTATRCFTVGNAFHAYRMPLFRKVGNPGSTSQGSTLLSMLPSAFVNFTVVTAEFGKSAQTQLRQNQLYQSGWIHANQSICSMAQQHSKVHSYLQCLLYDCRVLWMGSCEQMLRCCALHDAAACCLVCFFKLARC